MPTVLELMKRLLPSGTNPSTPGGQPDWMTIPGWPPDLFALTATLVNLSGCYIHARYTGWDSDGMLFGPGHLCGIPVPYLTARRSIREIVKDWQEQLTAGATGVPPEIAVWWSALVAAGDQPVYRSPADGPQPWHDAAFQLLIAADETCGAVGFTWFGDPVPLQVLVGYGELAGGRPAPPHLPHLPHSLCRMVPPAEACVQPKVMTPQVGCTLRSFSHHLALLPSIGEVQTSWWLGRPDPPDERIGVRNKPLSLLLIPYPYAIAADCFAPGLPAAGHHTLSGQEGQDNQHSFFNLTPRLVGFEPIASSHRGGGGR